jgi:hypothetical protein
MIKTNDTLDLSAAVQVQYYYYNNNNNIALQCIY